MAGIVGLGVHLPGEPVTTDFFYPDGEEPLRDSPLLSAPRTRHHVTRGETAAAMVEAAARPLFDRLEIDPATEVDAILTNVLLPDLPLTGCGAEVAARLGCAPKWVLDLHNGGCASFPYMLRIAALLFADGARSALLCNVQNTAGQIFLQPGVRNTQSAVLAGDGTAVAYLRADGGGSELLAVKTRNRPGAAADMGLSLPGGRRYWEAGEGPAAIHFDETAAKEIVARGNAIVPEVVGELCAELGVATEEIDVLVTNQPNRIFLRNWRRALGVPADRHLDSFGELGNLYGAGVPVTLARAEAEGRLGDGDLVVLAGFAHAGDFAAAAGLRWRA